jgi:O-antigen/teichoic acid export membrane protein
LVLALRTEFLLVVLGRVVTALIAVGSLRVMTALLAPSDYGQWAVLMAFQTFCTLFLINPVDQHVFRHAHEWWDNGTLLSHLKKFEQYVRWVSLVIMIVVLLWGYLDHAREYGDYAVVLIAGLSVGALVYFGTGNMLLVTFLNVLGFRAQGVIIAITGASAALTCSVIFAATYPHAISWVLGQSFGLGVGAWGAWHVLRKHALKADAPMGKITFADFLNRNVIVRFCLPLAAATGLMWLQNSGYRFLVSGVWGAADLGLLVVGLGLSAQMAGLVETLAMQFLYPYFARRLTDAKTDVEISAALSDLMNVLAPIYAIWAGLNAICAPALLEVLTDARYHVATHFVILGAMIEFARCTTNLWSNTARAVRQTRGLILPYALGAAVVWGGALVSIHYSGELMAFSVVLVAAGAITCVAMVVAMIRLLPISIDVIRTGGALAVMLACFALASVTTPKVEGLLSSLIFLMGAGLLTGLFALIMLWRSPALSRLLSATLRGSN